MSSESRHDDVDVAGEEARRERDEARTNLRIPILSADQNRNSYNSTEQGPSHNKDNSFGAISTTCSSEVEDCSTTASKTTTSGGAMGLGLDSDKLVGTPNSPGRPRTAGALGGSVVGGRRSYQRFDNEVLPGAGRRKTFYQRMAEMSSKVGNFSIQYNLTCGGIAMEIMNSWNDERPTPEHPALYPTPDWAKKTLLALVFVGSIVGMVTMGYVSDSIGRGPAFAVTTGIAAASAFGCAFLTWGSSVYVAFCFFRFTLGIGVGGLYPLTAAKSVEQESEEDANNVGVVAKALEKSKTAGKNFAWQAPGACFPYIVALFVLWFSNDTNMQFRTILAIGLLPSLFVFLSELLNLPSNRLVASQNMDNIEETPQHDHDSTSTSTRAATTRTNNSVELREMEEGTTTAATSGNSTIATSPSPSTTKMTTEEENKRYRRTVIGTGGTWLLYDIAIYGTQIFAPMIVKTIFKDGDLNTTCWSSLFSTSLQIPGILLSVALVKHFGPKALNSQGFLMMSLIFFLFSISESYGVSPSLRFGLFCLLNFALSYGTQLGTYVLPAILFPESVRGTYHGISAGCGKFGAALGAFLFPLIDDVPTVMLIQSVVCLLGYFVNAYFITWPPPVESNENQNNAVEPQDARE